MKRKAHGWTAILRRQYLLERNLFPMAKLNGGDSQYALDYEVPRLTGMKLSVTPARDRGITTMDDPIHSIALGDIMLSPRRSA